ncbi:MAG: diacylglycerol kinase [Thermodesulfovibrionales bacterium]|nr:diacylglycerol kinase [Thermodesulfovibrionales bacterium]MDP3111755.1 diacylglycerol kinase [Thermodesulfovibrionales bacterium]
MPLKKWVKSANFAIEGILHAAKTQRHLRYHFYSAAVVLLASYILGVSRTEFLIISLSVIAVLLAEMFNTSIEAIVDIISTEHNEKARIVKDIAAGAVFVTAFGVAVIGYIILFPYIRDIFQKGLHITKHSKEEIAIISFILVLILVVITKATTGKGHPLRGGLPSGHAALAFSVWVAITYITESFITSVLCITLAVLIAQSRIIRKIHTIWEVILGSLMGALVTFLLFRLFS